MIDVMIITHNESVNLPHSLTALQGWVNNIFVVDSGSTDGTQDIARSLGAKVVHHDWEGYARQKNWGLNNIPFESDWVLLLDADEIVTPKVRSSLEQITSKPADQVPENGFFVNRLTYFMGQPIRHCGYYPSWNLRLFKRGIGQYEDRAVHEHVIIDDPVGYIHEPILHHDRRGLEHYITKHNWYSTLETQALLAEISDQTKTSVHPNLPPSARLNRWLKRYLIHRVPWPGLWRFVYMYIFRLGFLDGRAGLIFCRFISMYNSMLALKLREAKHVLRTTGQATIDWQPNDNGLAKRINTDAPQPKIPTDTKPIQMQPESSPWSFQEKIVRVIWMVLGRPMFRISFHNWYRFRAALLCLFGAKIGRNTAIRPTVNIEIPWMLELEDDVTIGDHAILYSLGKIHIGKRSIISQYAHLCAGTHDYTDLTFKLIRSPITIGDDAWIGTDAFIGPGVSVGNLSVVGARSSAYKDLPAQQVCIGNPARPVKERLLQPFPTPESDE